MKRKMIRIDQDLCTGCGECVSGCPEGAIQMIDGKARLINDRFCDGLGACIGHCPVDAITIEEREAQDYDEKAVIEQMLPQGIATIQAHLKHLKDHGALNDYQIAVDFLKQKNISVQLEEKKQSVHAFPQGCPGSQSRQLNQLGAAIQEETGTRHSQLTHWPIQLHLLSPAAPHYQGKDLLLAADCTAFAFGDFHKDFLAGKTLAIACPKLDTEQEIYLEKITALIDQAKINTLTVLIMQVPCCGGLLRLAQQAQTRAARKVPIKSMVISLDGKILKEEWL